MYGGGCRLSIPPASFKSLDWTDSAIRDRMPRGRLSSSGAVVNKKWWKPILQYGIGLALLAYVIHSNWEAKPGSQGPGLRDALSLPMRLELFLIAGLCCVVNVLQTFVRWYLLVRAQGLPFRLRDAFRLGLVGYFYNTFLPGSVGGDLVKAAFIAKEQPGRRVVAVSTVLIDRAIGLWALIGLVAMIGSAVWILSPELLYSMPDLFRVVKTAMIFVGITAVVWIALGILPERRTQRFARRLEWLPKVGRLFADMWRAIILYRRRGDAILSALMMSLVGHSGSVLFFYCASMTFQPVGEEAIPSLGEHFLLVPVGMAVQALFPAPGGIGGGEFVFGKLYALVGYPEANGVLGSLGARMWLWVTGAAGFAVYAFIKHDLPIRSASSVMNAGPVAESPP
jgi:hypothetical protein